MGPQADQTADQAGSTDPGTSFAWTTDERSRAIAFEGEASGSSSGPFLLRPSDLFAWPDPKPLIADFLMQGEDACLYSPPKSGKTFVALDAGLSLAARCRCSAI